MKKNISCFFFYYVLLLFNPLLLYAYETEIVHIKAALDGDTVVLEDGRRVRYLGINTPEWQEPFSIKAKRLNKELVNRRTAKLEFDKRKTDGYKRLLAYVYIDNEMINSRLVQEGLAHVFLIPPNTRYGNLFLKLQEKAKKQKKGMWAFYDESIILKITQLQPGHYKKGKRTSSYLRIANLSQDKINIGGYSLTNTKDKKFVFTDFSLAPGYTFIISEGNGRDGYTSSGQLKIHWNELKGAWNYKSGKALLFNPKDKLIGVYRYVGRRIFYGLHDNK
jgi:micrococcal nuclease